MEQKVFEMLTAHDSEMIEMGVVMYFACSEEVKSLVKEKFTSASVSRPVRYIYYYTHTSIQSISKLHDNIYVKGEEAIYIYPPTIYIYPLDFLVTANVLDQHNVINL